MMGATMPMLAALLSLSPLASQGITLQQEVAADSVATPAPAAAEEARHKSAACFPTILQDNHPTAGKQLHLVMVGNGLTEGIGDVVAQLARETGIWTTVKVDTVAFANFTLAEHAELSATNQNKYFPPGVNAVLFQEQSQVPGFNDWNRNKGGLKAWNDSLESIKYFAALTKQAGAAMAFLQNWGYQDGDSVNPIFPTYDVMQNLLTKGSRLQQSAAEDAQGSRVHVVPVGEVFRRVSTRDAADFKELYSAQQVTGKRKLLSDNGKWLAAAVILRSLTGLPPATPHSDTVKARLLADVPVGAGPCDGNPQFSASSQAMTQATESDAPRLAVSALAALGVVGAALLRA